MSILLDESNVRTWFLRGAGSDSLEGYESPSPIADISVEALVSRSVEAVDAKTAALVRDASNNPGTTPSMKDIWRHPDAHPAVLLLLLLDKYGPDFLEWHPDVLKLTLERDGISLSNKSWNKIQAVRVVAASPSPWRQWEVFHWVSRALTGETPNFVYLEQPELSQLIIGADLMKLVDPARTTSHEIDKFVAAVFKQEGIAYAPPPLDFAQRELDNRLLECSTCHALHRDDNDVACVTCGEATLTPVPNPFDQLKRETRDLFEERSGRILLADAVENLPDSSAGSAVYRLLLEWDIARTAKAHMLRQFRMIGK
jgi:hypothetical protein